MSFKPRADRTTGSSADRRVACELVRKKAHSQNLHPAERFNGRLAVGGWPAALAVA